MITLRKNSRWTDSSLRDACRHAGARIAAWALAAAAVVASPLAAPATTVRIETTLGNIDVELYDEVAPLTVRNFLRYAGRGDYTFNGFINYSTPEFAIRGGGFTFDFDPDLPCHLVGVEPDQACYAHIPEDPPIPDEVFPPLLNAMGTISMFRPCEIGNQDTGTCDQWSETVGSEWTINLADNLPSLNNVFGQVVAGMDVADAIGSLPVRIASVPHISGLSLKFISIPLIDYDPSAGMQPDQLVRVLRIPNVIAARGLSGKLSIITADVDMTFDSFEKVDAVTAELRLNEFDPPPGESVFFNNGIFDLKLTGAAGAPGRALVMYLDDTTNFPDRYYAYGPTADNNVGHWYDFTYDGVTGAEFMDDRIILHFVDGGRGDNDMVENGVIDHSSALAFVELLSAITSSSKGCSISAAASRGAPDGDWGLVAAFLAVLAIARKRRRRTGIN